MTTERRLARQETDRRWKVTDQRWQEMISKWERTDREFLELRELNRTRDEKVSRIENAQKRRDET